MEKKNSKLNNFIVQGGILAITGVIVRILGLAKKIPLYYIIGDEGNSLYNTAYNIYNVVFTIAVYGIPLSVSKLVAGKVGKKEYKNANRILRCAIVIALISGFIGSMILFVFSEPLANFQKEPMAYMSLRILAPTVFIVALLAVLRGYFQGLGTMIPSAISQLIEQIVLIAVSISCAYFFSIRGEKIGLIKQNPLYKNAYGAAGATVGCAVSAFVALLFMVFLYKAYSRKNRKLMYKDTTVELDSYASTFRVLLLTIIPIVVSSFINQLSNITDQTLHNNIMFYKGVEEMSANWGVYTGIYSPIINIPIAFAAAMGASSVPAIANVMRDKDYGEVKDKISRVIRITMIIAIPCAVGIAVLAPSIVYTLFSTTNKTAPLLIRLGAAGIVLFSLSTLTNGILQAMNRLIKPITHGIIALLLHSSLLTVLLFFTDMNVYAVAFSNNFLSLFICLMNLYSISKILDYKQEIKNTFIIPLISATAMGIVVYVLDRIFCANGVSRVLTVVNIVIGGVVYFLIMILTKGITRNELMAIPGGTKIYSLAHKLHLMK